MGKKKIATLTKKSEKTLTEQQFEVLRLLYRFRFGAAELIADAQGTRYSAAYTRLTTMTKQGYLDKRQDGHAKLQGKPAIYSLAKKGRDILGGEPQKYSKRVLNAIRKNQNPSESFVEQNLTNFEIYNSLKAAYDGRLVYLTRSNLVNEKYDFLPKGLPDGLLKLNEKDTDLHHFVYLINSNKPDFAHVRRVAHIFKYEDSGAWEAKTGAHFPKVLLICETKRLQTSIHKKFRQLAGKFNSEIAYASSLVELVAKSSGDKIWKTSSDELNTLTEV